MAKMIIYSEAIHTGKTSRLLEWLKRQENTFGFLTPDVNGLREIFNLATHEQHKWQVKEANDHDVIEVGKYCFLASGFELAQQLLNAFVNQKEGLFIIDEIGKLELKGKGLEPALSQCITNFKQRKDESTLILIVRDYLLEEVIVNYELEKASIIGHTYFENS
jgi:nucleoside-triphosphatase THEP1